MQPPAGRHVGPVPPVPPVPRRRTGEARPLLSVAAVVVLVLAGGALVRGAGWDLQDLAGLRPRPLIEVGGHPVVVPRPAPADGRELAAVVPDATGPHAFLHTAPDGSPVGYDPCRPVGYVLRPDGMPPGGEALLEDAMALVSAATGLALVPLGRTEESPAVERPIIQERYGTGWAPVLVAWADETEVPELAGQVAGVGGSAVVPGADGEGSWLAAGRLILDGPDLTAMLDRPDGYEQARAVVVHELAHVVGLDHVDAPGELMHPVTSERTELGPGDRQGLALVGAVACER